MWRIFNPTQFTRLESVKYHRCADNEYGIICGALILDDYFVVFVVNTGADDTKNYVPPQNITTATGDNKHLEFTVDTGSSNNNQVAAIGIVPSTLNQYDKISEKTFPHTTINYIAPLPESL